MNRLVARSSFEGGTAATPAVLRGPDPDPATLTHRALLDALPDREREAVMLAAEGYTNAEIASRMFISERTAKAHLSSAANKLDMGRVQMARLVERADLPARL